jgi:hypothetical protein
VFPARALLKLNLKIWMTIEEQSRNLLTPGSAFPHKYYFIINGLTGRIIPPDSINYPGLTIYRQFRVFFAKIG